MKKIGFIDYYLSEWHANHYPAWIREIDPSYEVAYAYADLDVSPVDGITTNQWCETFGVERCRSIREICEKSDMLILLSPDNPEQHLRYAKEVFPFGKPCYMDKTFAPDSKTAEEIFALAERYQVKLFSSSALRFATEFRGLEGPYRSVNISGAGKIDNYLIHFVEIAVCFMGPDICSVTCIHTGENCTLTLQYKDERIAIINMYAAHHSPSFGVAAEYVDRTIDRPYYIHVGNDYFKQLIQAILTMFDGGNVPVSSRETIAVMKIIDAVNLACTKPGVPVPVVR